jgi:UDP-MurNAc hydroxylase
MKFFNLGGATGYLEHKGKRILFDPWLDEGIFHGAWHHYPEVQLPSGGISSLGHFDYIYISHIHEDHCSLGTLTKLNQDAELIIMDRSPNFVLQFVKKNNLNFKKIHLIPPWKKTQINNDFEVSMVTADPGHALSYIVDSGIVLKWDNFVIYNSNDCAPYKGSLDFVKTNYEKVDLALLPYATGSSYPSCFQNLSHEEKLLEKSRLFTVGVNKFSEASNYLKPSLVMPFADQYVIVGKKYDLNKYMPHPSSPGILRDYFKDTEETKLLLLNSSQSFDLEEKIKVPADEYIYFSEEQKYNYASSFKDVKYDYEKFELSKSVNLHFLLKHAADNLFQKIQKMDAVVETKFVVEVFDWKRKFVLDNKNFQLEEVDYENNDVEPFLKVSVEASLLMLMLVGHISWNIADAALFINYTRIPNKYDPLVHSLWNYLKI